MAIALAQALADLPAWLFITIALLAILTIVLIAIAVTRTQLQPPVIDPVMPGREGEALTAIDHRGGEVLVNGECWSARSTHPIPAGQPIRIVAVHGLRLTVEQLEPAHET